MKYLYIFLLIILTVLVALFASQNTALVTVSFFSWSASGSLSLVLVITLAAGLVLGLLIMLPAVIGGSFKHGLTRFKLKRLEKKSDKAKAEASLSAAATGPEAPPADAGAAPKA